MRASIPQGTCLSWQRAPRRTRCATVSVGMSADTLGPTHALEDIDVPIVDWAYVPQGMHAACGCTRRPRCPYNGDQGRLLPPGGLGRAEARRGQQEHVSHAIRLHLVALRHGCRPSGLAPRAPEHGLGPTPSAWWAVGTRHGTAPVQGGPCTRGCPRAGRSGGCAHVPLVCRHDLGGRGHLPLLPP